MWKIALAGQCLGDALVFGHLYISIVNCMSLRETKRLAEFVSRGPPQSCHQFLSLRLSDAGFLMLVSPWLG